MKAFEPKFSTFRADYSDAVASSRTTVTVRAQLIDRPDAVGVLALSANALTTSCEALQGEASCDGCVQLKIMYNSKEGAQSVNVTGDFTCKMTCTAVTPQTKLMCMAEVISCDTTEINADEICVNVTVDVVCRAVIEKQVKYLECIEGACDCETDITDIEICGVSANAACTFNNSGSTEVKEIISGVLLSSAKAQVRNCSAGLDCVLVTGDIYVNVCYKTEADNCNVRNIVLEIPFKDELVASGALVGHGASALIGINNVKILAEVDEELRRSHITAEVDYHISATAISDDRISVARDVFCEAAEIKTVTENVAIHCLEGMISFSDRVATDYEIPDGSEIDKVLATSVNSTEVTACYFDGDKLIVEGVVETAVICCGESGLNAFNITSPFVISQNADSCCDNMQPKAKVIVSGCTPKHKRTREIDLILELDCVVTAMCTRDVTVICEVVEECEKPQPEAPIEVMIAAGGETVWNMAKCLGVSPREIERQNPNLEFPLTVGDKVIVFHG